MKERNEFERALEELHKDKDKADLENKDLKKQVRNSSRVKNYCTS